MRWWLAIIPFFGACGGGDGGGSAPICEGPGAQDRAFGSTIESDDWSGVTHVATISDGRVVVAYETSRSYALAGFDANGRPDLAFGDGGRAEGAREIEDPRVSAVIAQPDGKILVGGFADVASKTTWFVARHDVDGAVDTTFGTNGFVAPQFSNFVAQAGDLALQADGKIVQVGSRQNTTALLLELVVARYLPDGSLDPSFGEGGLVVQISPDGHDRVARGVAVDRDDKIVVAGFFRQSPPASPEYLLVARLLPDGTPDAAFGAQGTTITMDRPALGRDVALRPDGSLLVVGDNNEDPAVTTLAAYTTAGALDSTFGLKGPPGGDSIAMQDDGKFFVGNVELARHGVDGEIDGAYASNGLPMSAMKLQADGKLVVATGRREAGTTQIVLARFCP